MIRFGIPVALFSLFLIIGFLACETDSEDTSETDGHDEDTAIDDEDDSDDGGDDFDDDEDEPTEDDDDDDDDDATDDDVADDDDDDSAPECENPVLHWQDDFESYIPFLPPGNGWSYISAGVFTAPWFGHEDTKGLKVGIFWMEDKKEKYVWFNVAGHPLPEQTCDVFRVNTWARALSPNDVFSFCLRKEGARDDKLDICIKIDGMDTTQWHELSLKVDKAQGVFSQFVDGNPIGGPFPYSQEFDYIDFEVIGLAGIGASPGAMFDDVKVFDEGAM